MAKKSTSTVARATRTTSAKSIKSVAPIAAPAAVTPVRNSSIPPRPQPKAAPTHEQIAKRAYEIWQSGKGGSQVENWYRAERELRGA